MTSDPFRVLEDADIAEAERNLTSIFAYVEFLKGGSNVANAYFEPAVILPGSSDVDISQIAESAWNHSGVPKDWLPFVEGNGDYFCVSQNR